MKFNAMFQPINIGPMTVKNRFVVPPMGNNFANTDGSMKVAVRINRRAEGIMIVILIITTTLISFFI